MGFPGGAVLCCAQSLNSVSSVRTLQRHGPQPARLLHPWDSQQECWSGLPCPPPGDLPNPEIEPRSPTLQAMDSLPSKPQGSPQMALVVKNLPANAGHLRGAGSIPGLGRSTGEENGNSFQYSYLENPMDRGACWAMVHGITQLNTTSTFTFMNKLFCLFSHNL